MSREALTNEDSLKESYEPISKKNESKKKDIMDAHFKDEKESLKEFYKPL